MLLQELAEIVFGWKSNTNKWDKVLLFFGKKGVWERSKMEDFFSNPGNFMWFSKN